MSRNWYSPTERNEDELLQNTSIGDLLQAIAHDSEGIHQDGDDHVSSRGLLGQLLSMGSLRLLRRTGDDVATSRRGQDDNDPNIEDGEQGHQYNDEDEYEDDLEPSYWGRPHARTPKWFPPVTTPQEAGLRLLKGGEFGRVGVEARSWKGSADISKAILSRRSKIRQTPKQDIANTIIPNTSGTAVASLTDNIYCGQYSADSSFYYTCCRDFRLHIYDMTAPPSSPTPVRRPTERPSRRLVSHEPTTLKVMKVIKGVSGGWTITDAHLSPDNERIIYSSIDSTVHMATTLDSSSTQIPIPFADPVPTRRRRFSTFSDFGIWSCKFSADGNEVVAGGDGKIFVYDLLANRRTVKIDAHQADVNSCCWADTASGNVLISASDDTFLKVWCVNAHFSVLGITKGQTQGSSLIGLFSEAFGCLDRPHRGVNERLSEGRRPLRDFQWEGPGPPPVGPTKNAHECRVRRSRHWQ